MAELRPRLHRYCARMVGSAIDGRGRGPGGPRQGGGGVSRRRRDRTAGELAVSHRPQRGPRRIAPPQAAGGGPIRRRPRPVWRTPAPPPIRGWPRPRAWPPSCACPPPSARAWCLIDVLGHSLAETAEILDVSLPAVKAALHRGRARLKELADCPRRSGAPPGRSGARAAARLCRPVQRPRLRRAARPPGRGRAARPREPHAPRRPQGRLGLFQPL